MSSFVSLQVDYNFAKRNVLAAGGSDRRKRENGVVYSGFCQKKEEGALVTSEETWEKDNHESYRYGFKTASNFVMLLEWGDEK